MNQFLQPSVGAPFWIFAIVIIVSAYTAVAAKRLKHSLFALFVCLVAISGIYALLHAWFLVYMHLLLYLSVAGVMFYYYSVFSLKKNEQYHYLLTKNKLVASFISLGFAIICTILIARTAVWRYAERELEGDNMYIISNYLTTEYIYPFMVVTFLIIVSKIIALKLIGDKKS